MKIDENVRSVPKNYRNGYSLAGNGPIRRLEVVERGANVRAVYQRPVALALRPENRHALAIVAHDGAKACDVVAFARRIQRAVVDRFGVRLTPEPVFWGVGAP